MKKEGVEYEWISFAHVPKEIILKHFPHIYEKCLEEGYDLLKEPAPIVPAQHYFMGGVHVNRDSATTMQIYMQSGRRAATEFTERIGLQATAC